MKSLTMMLLFSSLALAETFQGHGLGLHIPRDWQIRAKYLRIEQSVNLPDHFDWREKLKKQIPVLDQGSCGSCWAFSRVETFMWQILIHEDSQVSLAPQELVSCDTQQYGCGGGYWSDYEQSGISEESAFPYKARNLRCKSDLPRNHKLAEWHFIGAENRRPTTDEVKQAIFQYGPVGVTVSASGNFPNGCGGWATNHMVVLTGWDDAKKSWVMQNSWGKSWGNKGYAMVRYGCYNIAETAAVAILDE